MPRCGSERCGSERSPARGRVSLLCRFTRAREAPTAPQLAARVERCRRFLFSEFRILESGRPLEPAPVELSYGAVADTMAPTSARQGGARARSVPRCGSERCGSERSPARGRVNLLCRFTRARGADRAAAAARVERCRRFLFSEFRILESGRPLEPAPVELSYGAVADTMAPTSARQGGARARSVPRCGSERCGSERSPARGRVNLLCRFTRARGADRAAALPASSAVADFLFGNSGSWNRGDRWSRRRSS